MARRPSRIYGWLGAATALACVAAAAAVFWTDGGGETAPTEAGVCWRMVATDPTRYAVLGRNVENLESCAASLEAIHLQTRGNVNGAFQGRFIFIDSNAIRSAETLDGARWRIFYGPQREALDRRLRAAQSRAAGGPTFLPVGP